MRDRLAAQVAPDDWPEGAAGYNWNPFAGVKVDGYFQEHHVDEQSQDPKIQEQNQKLWDACDEGDIEGVVDALKHGAEVNAGDPSEDWMWTALMHCCAPEFAEGLPSVVCQDSAPEVEAKRIEVLDCLLEHGARVQVTDIFGETPSAVVSHTETSKWISSTSHSAP
mmetsp:Transcript_4312/g.6850  ORF Transcript_4312/g.6850 Transcript_4312/m.6850 type:complete len:166 (-) Transcript_4312:1040-1537(-)